MQRCWRLRTDMATYFSAKSRESQRANRERMFDVVRRFRIHASNGMNSVL